MNRLCIYLAFLLMPLGVFAQSDAFYFIQMTDPQFGMIERNKGFSEETKSMEKAVAAINKLDPAFVVVTGDLVNDGRDQQQMKEYKRISAQIKKTIPVYVTPGNHDVGQQADDESLANYRNEYGYDCFSFQIKNCCFVGLNTPVISAGRTTQEGSQFIWLEKILENSQRCNHRILFGHHPIFVEAFNEPDKYENFPMLRRMVYLDLFDKYRVGYMFAGHLHYNSQGTHNQFQVIGTSAVGMPIGTDKLGIRIVKVYPDKVLSAYYDLDHIPSHIDL